MIHDNILMIAISIWVLACTLLQVNTCYCSRGGSNGGGGGFNLNGGGFNNNLFLGCDNSADCNYFANGGFSDTGSCMACYQCCCLNYPGIGPCAAAAAAQAPAGGSTSQSLATALKQNSSFSLYFFLFLSANKIN